MSIKKFETRLKELLAGLDKNEKLSPSELLERASDLNSRAGGSDVVISAALKNPRFLKKVTKSVRRSDSGRVVLYARKGEAVVMTLERWDSLRHTVKNAQEGVRKYWAARRKTPAKTPVQS